jgi:hypothetical protein
MCLEDRKTRYGNKREGDEVDEPLRYAMICALAKKSNEEYISNRRKCN